MLRAQKFSIAILIVILFCLGLFGYLLQQQFTAQKSPTLEVDFLDVGQGDAILIKTPYQQNILIDGGPDNSVINQLGKQLPFYDKTIDLMILTHPDADHATGLPEVLRRYEVKKVLYTGVAHTTPAFIEWLKLIKEKNIPMETAFAGQKIDLGAGLLLEIFWPKNSYDGQRVENNNITSIVAKLIYKNTSFLLTGDMPIEAEQGLLAEQTDPLNQLGMARPSELRADVLKVAHHGSKYSSSKEFLEAVEPKFAIISVGKDNQFGHPHVKTLNSLSDIKAKILRTDQSGAIQCLSDGEKAECGSNY